MTGHWHRGIAISVTAILSALTFVGCATAPAPTNVTTSNNTASSNQTTGTTPNTSTHNSTDTAQSNSANTAGESGNSIQNSVPSNQMSTTPATTFDPKVVKAMQYVKKQGTRMPLMAPTQPAFTPTVSHLGAEARIAADGTSYTVSLFATNRQLAFNDPSLDSLPAMNIIGSFGATLYPSAARANAQLEQPISNSIAPVHQAQPNIPSKTVDLGTGITGTAYDAPSSTPVAGSPMVQWHEGEWTFQVWDGTISEDVKQAKSIISYLHTHLLPETHGMFGENIAGDGDHTSVTWVYGNTLYNAFSYHSGLQAAQMAVSARVYPSGQMKPGNLV